jgi:hypothetical protein
LENLQEELGDLVGQDVVIDTQSSMIYVGRLERVGRHVLVLGASDIHDMKDSQSSTTKEMYVMEARKLGGPHVNREGVRVMIDKVLSISRLDEVIEF